MVADPQVCPCGAVYLGLSVCLNRYLHELVCMQNRSKYNNGDIICVRLCACACMSAAPLTSSPWYQCRDLHHASKPSAVWLHLGYQLSSGTLVDTHTDITDPTHWHCGRMGWVTAHWAGGGMGTMLCSPNSLYALFGTATKSPNKKFQI